MNKTDLLLLEKRRHNLKETISKKEKILLEQGAPIQKIIGFIDFDNLKIKVDKNVLIPRYETQEVVNKALEFVKENHAVLDLCCGSGYIGLTIKQKTNADVTLSDISNEAIVQSKINALDNNLQIKIIKSNMFENITDKFDVIISNPPYIPSKNIPEDSVLNHDPHNALFAGEDGNDFYKIIVNDAPNYLKKNGVLILEISKDNKCFLESCNFLILNDINNKPRIAYKTYE